MQISGFSLRASFTASVPLDASPTTVHPGCDSSKARMPRRTTTWSSPIRMRSACIGEKPANPESSKDTVFRRSGEQNRHKISSAESYMSIPRKSRKSVRQTHAAEGKEFLDPKLRETLDQMPVLVWTADRVLRCTSALGGAGLPAGVNANRLVGKTIRQLLYPNFEPAWSAHRKALEGTPQNYRREFRGRAYEASVEPLVGSDGKIIGIVGAAMDVTERHHAETQASRHQKMFAAIAKKGWEGLLLNSRE